MYVVCDPMLTLDNGYWLCCSYVDALKFFFNRTDSKEAIVFRDVRGKGSCSDLQFICRVERRKFAKFLKSAQG